MGKVLIIDSGMRNLGGHNFSYTSAVQTVLEQKGFVVTVLANKNLASDVAKSSDYHPVFSFGAYDYPAGNGPVRDLLYLYAQSVIYSDELEQALSRISIEDYALIFCHTVNDFELIGWNRYLARHKFSGRLMILLRHTPGFRACRRWKQLAHPYWRIKPHYLNALRAKLGERFVLLTDSEPLSEDYARIYRHQIVTLPIPINGFVAGASGDGQAGTIGTRYKLGGGAGICIGYMGDARPAKGFALLPELVRRVLAEPSAEVKFVIQCPGPASGYSNGHSPEGMRELTEMARATRNKVTLIAEHLSERDYADLFHHLDIVLIPYLANGYTTATSGIFAEALALAKPVVVPSGTWMARELRKSGGGVEFPSNDVNALTANVLRLVREYDQYTAKARSFSAAWRAFHNSHTLVEILLRASGLPSAALTN